MNRLASPQAERHATFLRRTMAAIMLAPAATLALFFGMDKGVEAGMQHLKVEPHDAQNAGNVMLGIGINFAEGELALGAAIFAIAAVRGLKAGVGREEPLLASVSAVDIPAFQNMLYYTELGLSPETTQRTYGP